MTQPDKIHPGRLNLNPIFAKSRVTISIGQIIHQTLPRKTADNTTKGHQSLQIKMVVRLVLLRILMKKGYSEGEVKNPNEDQKKKCDKCENPKKLGNIYTHTTIDNYIVLNSFHVRNDTEKPHMISNYK